MNGIAIFSLFYLLFNVKYFVRSLDVRKDSWYRDSISTDDKENSFSDDIRCFCNLPQCISTSYMCRTGRSGNNFGCFSEINKSIDTSATVTRHGCIELLNVSNQRYHCDKSPIKSKLKLSQQNNNSVHNKFNQDHDSTEFLVLCCHEDMCNHIDNPENQKMKLNIVENIDSPSNSAKYQSINHHHQHHSQQQQHHQKLNQENFSDILEQDGKQSSLSSSLLSPSSSSSSSISTMIFSSPGRSNNDDWFRVATIAVPICGAIILFSLIAIAMKILRTDRSTSISLKLDNSSSLLPPSNGLTAIPTTTTNIKDFNHKFSLLDHEAQMTKNHNYHHHNQESPSSLPTSNLLEQYSSTKFINCNNNNSNKNFSYCDKKNETRAKFNQLLNIQYSLLPSQSINNNNINTNPTTLLDDNAFDNSSSSSSSSYQNNNEKLDNNNCIGISSLFDKSSKLFYKNNVNNSNNHNNNINDNLGITSSSSLPSPSSSLLQNNMMMVDKNNKIYAKDILSPICEN